MIQALQELQRVATSEGEVLLLTFQIGQTIHRDEWRGKEVSLDSTFRETEDVIGIRHDHVLPASAISRLIEHPQVLWLHSVKYAELSGFITKITSVITHSSHTS